MTTPRREPAHSTAVLVTTGEGTVLLAQGGPRPGGLPTAAIRHDQDPYTAGLRLTAALGLSPADLRCVAVDRTDGDSGPHTVHVMAVPTIPAGPPPAPGHAWVLMGQALAALPPASAARLRAACRAVALAPLRGTLQPLRLVDGRDPERPVSKAERTRSRFLWHSGRRPSGATPVHQVWGWLVDPYGRVLVMLDTRGVPSLPGGRPEAGEGPVETLAREAAEEAQACVGAPESLGHLEVREHGRPAYAQLRLTAGLQGLGPAAPDPDTGEVYGRVLVPVRQANLLLGWGPEGDAQAAAAGLRHGSAQRRSQYVPATGLDFTEG
ncbi:NUDIX domain-containing protein [Streptomyces sp. ISL-22]|uniref:NUDIX domain-containing protein n=1 Tax=unclassified Streptomyces TaxID=2593676 RepID=UPI001BECC86C|nr:MULTISPECIES: NUDIX domain-containing protein [unclassified Streptomyces]MBT2417999.1 NUDIX domain-containing protein [Streptomyces sp. ISL-24]MBT2432326.1 NUDIX domain-containing protein [Streptomyces sp. ISL-22]